MHCKMIQKLLAKLYESDEITNASEMQKAKSVIKATKVNLCNSSLFQNRTRNSSVINLLAYMYVSIRLNKCSIYVC